MNSAYEAHHHIILLLAALGLAGVWMVWTEPPYTRPSLVGILALAVAAISIWYLIFEAASP